MASRPRKRGLSMGTATIRDALRDDEWSQGMGDVNESAVKRKLGIPNWRNLSKDKVLKFAAAMPEMATEARLKLIEQFPAFKDLGKANIDAVAEAHRSTLAANENSQNHFYKAAQDQRDALQADLARDDLSEAQRESLHDRLERNVGRVFEKDSESKQFQGAGMKLVAATGVAALALSVAFVGGRVAGVSEDGSEESQ
ncbi:hypothetical protein L7D48_10570 [Streptomyces sp. S1A]|uniref:hypothetical protein n=1 Tax=Streptomyces sp. ICN903 TaxID=2964654 RepID=UPI001EDC303C|nr:hypothetical protein [Streptomyces sp. ICN903]MCG3041001.1 hypothetical protein [Streptomyces sp. ICN903]